MGWIWTINSLFCAPCQNQLNLILLIITQDNDVLFLLFPLLPNVIEPYGFIFSDTTYFSFFVLKLILTLEFFNHVAEIEYISISFRINTDAPLTFVRFLIRPRYMYLRLCNYIWNLSTVGRNSFHGLHFNTVQVYYNIYTRKCYCILKNFIRIKASNLRKFLVINWKWKNVCVPS